MNIEIIVYIDIARICTYINSIQVYFARFLFQN